MYKLTFYVPEQSKEFVKESLFNKGAGKYKNYDKCSWEVGGRGQFRPLEGSEPFVGVRGRLEYVNEFRIEMICAKEVIRDVVNELINVHPYEEPAYDILEIFTIDDF